MALREKYNYAIQTAKGFHMEGAAEERDGKLHFHGTVTSEDQKNKIWDAIKTIPDWQREVSADIRVKPGGPTQAASQASASGQASAGGTQAGTGQEQQYTVQAGDTLSAIAKRLLGDAGKYMAIYNLNRDQLSDPDRISPGQVLRIPQPAR